jgi:hypothetical protein
MLPGLTPKEAQDLILSVGTHHGQRRLSPVEVAQLFQKAIAAGATLPECARFVHLKSATMVSRFLRLLKLDPSIQHVVGWGQTGATVSFAASWPLGELSSDEQQSAAREIMANQLRTPEVVQLIQLWKRTRQPISRCVADVLGLRPTITRKHVLLGAVTDDSVKAALSSRVQSQRDELFARTLHELYGPLTGVSARLGTDRFTIVTGDKNAAVINDPGKQSFETLINDSLRNHVAK